MYKLDLHRTKHEDVASKVIRFIEANWFYGDILKIVTGHSSKMQEIVYKVLKEYKIETINRSTSLYEGIISFII